MIDTWTCHICGQERLDDKISVLSFPLKGLPGAEMNIRFCNDNEDCKMKAIRAGRKGQFPKRQSIKPVKKWWEFWK